MEKIITFVTGNRYKFEEISHLIKTHVPGYNVQPAKIELTEIQADTLEEVAIFKINSVRDQIAPPYFIEDSGFFVDNALHGFPGVYSAYVNRVIGNQGILDLMNKFTDKEERTAHFESVIAYIDEGLQIHTFKGINKGTVAYSARGQAGFGFDPVFISDDRKDKRTFAELTIEEKNQISHRTRAMMKFITYLKNRD